MPVAKIASGIELAYEERGVGEPMVLVAGIGMQLVAWPEGFLDLLAARGFRVIVFDHRDVGLSTKLDAAGVPRTGALIARSIAGLQVAAPYTLYDMADDVTGLFDSLGLTRAHLVGVSMGGMVAQAAAIAHGDRLASLVSMMSHPGRRLLSVGLPKATLKLLGRAPRTRAEAIEQHLDFFRTVGSTRFARDEVDLAARGGRAYDRCAYPQGFARHFAAILATGDLTPRLRRVEVPTLVLHGSVDPVIRAVAGRETAGAIPGAELHVIDGWGHDLAEGVWPQLVDAIASHAHAHAPALT